MIWIIIAVIIIIVFIVALVIPTIKSPRSNKADNYYTSGYSNIWLEKRKGYTKYQIVGMYYRKLKSYHIGEFEGYVKAETNNVYDNYAVAIYNNSAKHLGYLPSGNKKVHNLILENGGILSAYGYISCDRNFQNYTGEVAIKTNIVSNPDNPFYDQTIVIIGRLDISQKELGDKLEMLGAYISRTITPKTNIVLIGEKFGEVQKSKLETLIQDGYNIRMIYREELNNILKEYQQ